MPQIYDMGPTALLPLRRKACWGFFRPKNPTASAGFEPANLGTKGQHATPRPPKPLFWDITQQIVVIPYRCFGTKSDPIFKGHKIPEIQETSPWISLPLKIGSKVCPEKSVRNYHYRLRNVPEERHSSCKSVCLSLWIRSTPAGLLCQPLKKIKIWLKTDKNTRQQNIATKHLRQQHAAD